VVYPRSLPALTRSDFSAFFLTEREAVFMLSILFDQLGYDKNKVDRVYCPVPYTKLGTSLAQLSAPCGHSR